MLWIYYKNLDTDCKQNGAILTILGNCFKTDRNAGRANRNVDPVYTKHIVLSMDLNKASKYLQTRWTKAWNLPPNRPIHRHSSRGKWYYKWTNSTTQFAKLSNLHGLIKTASREIPSNTFAQPIRLALYMASARCISIYQQISNNANEAYIYTQHPRVYRTAIGCASSQMIRKGHRELYRAATTHTHTPRYTGRKSVVVPRNMWWIAEFECWTSSGHLHLATKEPEIHANDLIMGNRVYIYRTMVDVEIGSNFSLEWRLCLSNGNFSNKYLREVKGSRGHQARAKVP